MDWAEITLQAITLPLLDLLKWNFFYDILHEEDLSFFKISIFWGLLGKLKIIFELAENLSLVITKLDTELGLAQPQLVFSFFGLGNQKIGHKENRPPGKLSPFRQVLHFEVAHATSPQPLMITEICYFTFTFLGWLFFGGLFSWLVYFLSGQFSRLSIFKWPLFLLPFQVFT